MTQTSGTRPDRAALQRQAMAQTTDNSTTLQTATEDFVGLEPHAGSAIFSDPEMTKMRSSNDIASQWATMSAEDKAMLKRDCATQCHPDGDATGTTTGDASSGSSMPGRARTPRRRRVRRRRYDHGADPRECHAMTEQCQRHQDAELSGACKDAAVAGSATPAPPPQHTGVCHEESHPGRPVRRDPEDIYYAERKILRTLPKMARAATSPELKAAFEKHHGEPRCRSNAFSRCSR